MLLALLSCQIDPPQVRIASGPAPGPNPDAPMVATLTATTDRPATTQVRFTGGGRTWTTPTDERPGTRHDLLLLGMQPDTPYEIVVEATDASGQTGRSAPIRYTPPPLPADLPVDGATVLESDPDADGGLWVVSPWHFQQPVSSVQIFDDEGELQWVYAGHEARILDAQIDRQGHVWFSTPSAVTEVDLAGDVLRRFVAARTQQPGPGEIGVDVADFDHYLELLDDGFVAQSHDTRLVPDYPTSVLDPSSTAPALFDCDRILEIGLDGAIRAEWDSHDLLDVHRVRWDSLVQVIGYGPEQGYDWSHANGVAEDPADGGIVVSFRHQDAVIKFDRAGGIDWILGTPNGWTGDYADRVLAPKGDGFLWPRHQHAPQIVRRDGHVVYLMVFDNGNYRPVPGTPDADDLLPENQDEDWSRLVEYRIDEDARTVEQVWVYGRDDEDFFTSCCSNAFVQPSGHVFVGDEGGRIVELTGDQPARKVLEIALWPAPGDEFAAAQIGRAYRVPDFVRGGAAALRR